MSSLRPYQQRVVADVRAALGSSGRSGIIMMPTGAGKTKTSVHGLCRPWLQASTANRLYWLVERKALVGQAAADLPLQCDPDLRRVGSRGDGLRKDIDLQLDRVCAGPQPAQVCSYSDIFR